MFFITLGTRQGYHHIFLLFQDSENVAFFIPDGKKEKCIVIPFGLINAPSFYTAIMKTFQGNETQISTSLLLAHQTLLNFFKVTYALTLH